MEFQTDTARRRFLQAAGAGTSAAVAGCMGLQLSGQSSEDDSEGDADPDDPRATAVIQPDPEEVEAIRAEVQREYEEGELDEGEANAELQSRQQELLAETGEAFEAEAQERDVEIVDAIREQGAYLVAGSAEGILELLDLETVYGLVSAAVFEEAQGQRERGGQNQSEEEASEQSEQGGDQAQG
ncbi:hypothetical protein ACNS7O_13835 [Haloferacaceae archaeon DSL9]